MPEAEKFKPKFGPKDRVCVLGKRAVYTVEDIRQVQGDETIYTIQLGNDFASRRQYAESELEWAT